MTNVSGKNWLRRISVLLPVFIMLITVIMPSGIIKTYADEGPETKTPITVNLNIANNTALNDLNNELGSNIKIPNSAKGGIFKKPITLKDGDNLIDVIKKELSGSNIAYKLSKDGGRFSEISGLKESIYIVSSVIKNGKKVEGDFSGWICKLNGSDAKVGLNRMRYGTGTGSNDIELKNGDSIDIKYTVDGVTFDKEYKQSFSVDSSIKNIELTVGETYNLPLDKLKVEPENWAAAKDYDNFFFNLENDKIAKVDNSKDSVKIIAKSAGKTNIRIETPNELSDNMTVTVKSKTTEKPEPRILVAGNVWDMNKIFEAGNQGPHALKVQVKKGGKYIDVDPNEIEWKVSNGGNSRVWKNAFWITVYQEATFTATLKEYPDEKVFFKAKLKPVSMTDFDVKLPTTYKIGAWNTLTGKWSSKGGGGNFVGILEGNGTDNYKIIPKPANAVNTGVTWEALTPEIATYMNGIMPNKAGTARFKVASNTNPGLSKVVEVKLEYETPLKSAEFAEKEIVLKEGQSTTDLGLKLDPERASEQRFNWTFDKEGIVDNEEIVESPGTTGNLPTFTHKITALKKGTVMATAVPWDTTSGAKPIKVKIHVIGDLDIKPDSERNEGNNVAIEDGKLIYTKETSLKATYYISNGILSRLQRVKVDGTEIDNTKYEVMEGSIILTLKKEYMDTLAAGVHKLAVETKDGTVETEFVIKDAPVKAKYKATYEFKSLTKGKVLPAEIAINLLPADVENIEDQTKIVATKPTKTSVKTQGGKWIFRGYIPKEAVVNGADIKFVGGWEFIKDNPQQNGGRNVSKYYFESGANSVWKTGDKDLLVVVKSKINDDKTFDHFKEIEIDGKKVDSDNYDATRGSVRIKLHSSYLKTLSTGRHVLKVNFDNGSIKTGINIAANTRTVKTGDYTDLGYMFLLLIAVLVLMVAITIRKKVQ